MYFSNWDSNTYFFLNIILLMGGGYVFYWKRNTKLNLKSREIFPMERNSARDPRNEIWWKAGFLSDIGLCIFFEKKKLCKLW